MPWHAWCFSADACVLCAVLTEAGCGQAPNVDALMERFLAIMEARVSSLERVHSDIDFAAVIHRIVGNVDRHVVFRSSRQLGETFTDYFDTWTPEADVVHTLCRTSNARFGSCCSKHFAVVSATDAEWCEMALDAALTGYLFVTVVE